MKNVFRYQVADYLDVSTTSTESYALMGGGFTQLDENPNAQVSEKAYVNDKSSTRTTRSYNPQFPFNAEVMEEEAAINFIYDISRNRKAGSAAETNLVRVELWKPISGKTNTFAARKQRVSVEVSGVNGNATEELVLVGNLNGVGDQIDGEFNTTTRAFTATVVEDEE